MQYQLRLGSEQEVKRADFLAKSINEGEMFKMVQDQQRLRWEALYLSVATL